MAQLLVICLTFQVICTIVAVIGINVNKGRITGFILASVFRPSSMLAACGPLPLPLSQLLRLSYP